ncbi:MAG: nucleoside triphosphate pyrophosphohydrolase [Chitinophagales bacterium]|jgi:XTP/dITP diphosphohydrolase|nr:nucleoside triphosphate pyrophosphohydrolase [Chitinophagales bacterium]
MDAVNTTEKQSFYRLVQIMEDLREKCPWDRKQTIHTLRTLTIEEMYEMGDAILQEDWTDLKKELGDLMLHLVFYAKIASEEGHFAIGDVIESICEKLIFRHPHVYGELQVENEDEVKRNWEQLKLKEGNKSVLGGVPKGLPAMVKALRMQEKAKQVGFEWDTAEQVWEKVKEEEGEFKEALASEDKAAAEEEFGDLLFSLINYARFKNIDPETALEKTNQKFLRRFQGMEQIAASEGKSFASMNLQEMDALWNQIKSTENK